MPSRIAKLYIANFLTGLVFWFGVEKLFMASIGIDAMGVGLATAFLSIFNLLADIPAGILADKWSRKGVLIMSSVALIAASITLGTSHSLWQYLIGYSLYGMSIVCTSGTYQAIIYDTLHEENRAADYSKTAGRSWALFLVGAGVANIASGFITNAFDYRATFFATVGSCVLNIFVLASIKEPTFHKAEQKEKTITQLGLVIKAVSRERLLAGMAIVISALMFVEVFKVDFGQLYFQHYAAQPQVIGLLWAAYAFTWALGSAVAHRMHNRVTTLVFATVLPLILMAFIDNWVSVALFLFQAIAAAALVNQVQTRIQDSTPSSVRASVLSVLSVFGRLVSIPASFFFGWVFLQQGAFMAARWSAFAGVIILLFWMVVNRRPIEKPQA